MEKIVKKLVAEIPATPEHEVEEKIYVCDLCGKESTNRQSFRQCVVCGRLVCGGYSSKCLKGDPEDWGDYPDPFCIICVSLTKKYSDERYAIDNEHNEKLDRLKEKIKVESLNSL